MTAAPSLITQRLTLCVSWAPWIPSPPAPGSWPCCPPQSPALSHYWEKATHRDASLTCPQACGDQLSPASLETFIRQMELREKSPESHDGCFEMLPREVIIKIFSFLDLISLVRVSAVCRSLRHVSRDPWLYTCVDIKQLWQCHLGQHLQPLSKSPKPHRREFVKENTKKPRR